MENPMGAPHATGSDLEVPRLAMQLVRFYRDEVIPDQVSEFESWGFEKDDLKSSDETFFSFCVLAAYDRQPFTFKGGYEAVWSEDPGSVRRLLESRRLLKLATIRALSEDDLRGHLQSLVFGPWRLAHDRKRQGSGGTDYARTLHEIGESAEELRTLCVQAVSEWDVASLHYRFDSFHGIGPTIAAKLVTNLLRKIDVGEVPPDYFGRLVPHLIQEYANSALLKQLSSTSPQTLGRRVQAEVAKQGEPLAIEALFYADKVYEGRIPGRYQI